MPRWLPLIFVVSILGAMGVFVVSRISQAGLNRIKRHEAFSPVPYLDEAGKPTIGWGHLIRPGESFTRITEAQGEDILRRDLAEAESAVDRLVKVSLTQSQYDALVSLVFNIGAAAFAGSTLLSKLNAGDYDGAYAEFPRWNKVTVSGVKVVSNILSKRRADEQALFIA